VANASEYAIFKDGSKQHKVAKGDVVDVDLRDKAEPGQVITFENVMLLRTKDDVQIGRPTLVGVKVSAEVSGPVKGDKLISYRYRHRKGFHKKIGHRQKYTRVTIKEIGAL
jgi:large subunit ribosomal protein L21